MRPRPRPRPRSRRRPRTALSYLPVLLALAPLLSGARAISKEASEVQSTFVLQPSPGQCADSIQHAKIALYKGINPNDADRAYDGLLWRDLKLNGRPCPSVHNDIQSTFFKAQTQPSALGTASTTPWFLVGVDNSPRRCSAYSTNLQARYLFTRDLPRFRRRFERDSFLLPGVAINAKRGMVFMFVVPFGSHSFLEGAPCVYADERDAEGLVSNVSSGDDDVQQTSEAAAAGGGDADNSDDGPACFGAHVEVRMADGSLRRVSDLKLGHFVAGVHSPQRVVAFSHADPWYRATFVALRVGVRRANSSWDSVVSLQVTSDHVLYDASNRALSAEQAQVGTTLRSVQGEAVVLDVRQVRARGVWAPVTTEGVVVVRGGMVVSCYSRLFDFGVAHALLAPVRAFWSGSLDWGLVVSELGRGGMEWIRACSRLKE